MTEQMGRSQLELIGWLSDSWLQSGPPVCILEGVSGTGKTTIARELLGRAKAAAYKPVMVNSLAANDTLIDELLVTLATALHNVGNKELSKAVGEGKSLEKALARAMREPVLIVVDEFQNALEESKHQPPARLKAMLKRLADSSELPGRILLISNQPVSQDRWSEPYEIRVLSGLDEDEAVRLLSESLLARQCSQKLPPARYHDVVHWLGCNPRAIGVLAESLKARSLDSLIRVDLEWWETKDQDTLEQDASSDRVFNLEKSLLEQNLAELPLETLFRLFRLSVYRQPFKQDVVEQLLLGNGERTDVLLNELMGSFVLKQKGGWLAVNPAAKENMLDMSKSERGSLLGAHSLAADHYTQCFDLEIAQEAAQETAQLAAKQGRLGGYFVEAKYHLANADRIKDLAEISHHFEPYIIRTYHSNGSVSLKAKELNARITILTALLEKVGDEGLAYYLARLLKSRARGKDIPRALFYARKATGSQASPLVWVFRSQLEQTVNGADLAINVLLKGIKTLPDEEDASLLYERCSSLLVQNDRTEEAAKLLKQGINRASSSHAIGALYGQYSELLVQDNREGEAIALLKQGLEKTPASHNRILLYGLYGDVLAKSGHTEEAIALLKQGIAEKSYPSQLFPLYEQCSALLLQLGRQEDAVALLKDDIKTTPNVLMVALYDRCSSLLAELGRTEEAIGLLKEAIETSPSGTVFSFYDRCGVILDENGRTEEAIALLKAGIDKIPQNKGRVIVCRRLSQFYLKEFGANSAIDFLIAPSSNTSFSIKEQRVLLHQAALLAATERSIKRLQELADLTASGDYAEQHCLIEVFLAQAEDDWAQAAKIADRGIRNLRPNMPELKYQRIFSYLCCQNIEKGERALTNDFYKDLTLETDMRRPVVSWLSALLACLKEQPAEAIETHLSTYLGRPLKASEKPELGTVLQLWEDSATWDSKKMDMPYHFPTLPSSLTGLDTSLTRTQRSPAATESKTIPQASTEPSAVPHPEAPPTDETVTRPEPYIPPRSQNAIEKPSALPLAAKVGIGVGIAAAIIAALFATGIIESPTKPTRPETETSDTVQP